MDSSGWNDRYQASPVWSGEPNDALVTTIQSPKADRDPGSDEAPTAIDLGCGEGADAMWLARQGWSVIGVDWAGVALDRARAAGADLDLDARFVEGDVTDGQFLAGLSPTGDFDLVTVCFLHPEPEDRSRTFAHLPRLVAPDGRLLVLAHDPEHGERGLPGPPLHRMLSPATILEQLGLPGDFTVERCDVHRREQEGQVTAVDSVVLAHRSRA